MLFVDVFALYWPGMAWRGVAWRDRVDLLSKLFCSAVYSKSLASLTADSAAPLAQTLRSQLNILKNRVRVPCMSHKYTVQHVFY